MLSFASQSKKAFGTSGGIARDQGRGINPIGTWEELVKFVRNFSRMTYDEGAPAGSAHR
ncbi:MAG: hypothetical protein HZB53_22045 [Chloroflexi bacterium]|nr:hypothetical protein [Chloroflexota bacterium]